MIQVRWAKPKPTPAGHNCNCRMPAESRCPAWRRTACWPDAERHCADSSPGRIAENKCTSTSMSTNKYRKHNAHTSLSTRKTTNHKYIFINANRPHITTCRQKGWWDMVPYGAYSNRIYYMQAIAGTHFSPPEGRRLSCSDRMTEWIFCQGLTSG